MLFIYCYSLCIHCVFTARREETLGVSVTFAVIFQSVLHSMSLDLKARTLYGGAPQATVAFIVLF